MRKEYALEYKEDKGSGFISVMFGNKKQILNKISKLNNNSIYKIYQKK